MEETLSIRVGNVIMGGNSPITIQSMTNTDTRDWRSTIKQIQRLEQVGCEIVRAGIPDMDAATALGKIKERIHIPLVADIHFDYKLALEAIKQGVDKVRINPGNIGSKKKVRVVVDACRDKDVPIRIGVNAGSIAKELLNKYGPTPEAAVESCLEHVRILEDLNFSNIAISVKFSDVEEMILAYRLLAEKVRYPLHLGVTHAGTSFMGTIKNVLGIGVLLREGIGSTMRVSLTAPPEQEVKVGWGILNALGIRKRGPELISCPTCARKQLDVERYASMVEEMTSTISSTFKIAVMGCSVNGPGEAKQADIGIAGGKGATVVFKYGEKLQSGNEEDMIKVFFSEIKRLAEES
ncbi:MAG: hypothetical protein QG620_294 [Patescibacteria group bacterium]|nr:hypothetical protein [Patescibacteria group bacterium]